MTYEIRRNYNLTKKAIEPKFTAKNWDSAVTKVATALKSNKELTNWLTSKGKNVKDVASEMIVEIGKDY